MSDYKPGTVAVATVMGVPNVRGLLDDLGRLHTGTRVSGSYVHHDSEVTDVRPLIVLDVDPAATVRTLRASATVPDREGSDFDAGRLRVLARQIEAQTRPPKPPEPHNLGAVVSVEDDLGGIYVRQCSRGAEKDMSSPWLLLATRYAAMPANAPQCEWREFGAVEVLTEGVKP